MAIGSRVGALGTHGGRRAMRADGLAARVNASGRHQCGGDWRLDASRTRAWSDLDLWVLVSGAGHVHTPEGVYPLEVGTCLILRGGQDYRFVPVRGKGLVHYWAHFDYVDARGRRVPHRKLALPRLYRRVGNPGLLFGLLERVNEERRDPRGDRGRSDRWFGAALMEVARQDGRGEVGDAGRPADRIEGICAAVREDPGGEHRVSRMAEQVGYDPAYFCRLFRKHVGVPPRRYVTRARMEAAQFLLRDSATPVGRIAEALGYHDVHFFSRHFSGEFGVSPSAYRRAAGGGRRQ